MVLQPNIGAGENTEEVQKWLENYRRERMDKTPAKTISIVADTPVSPTPPSPAAVAPRPQSALFDLGVRTSADILAQELCKRSRIKRGLVSELEQENISQIQQISGPPAAKMGHRSPASSPIKPGLNLIQPVRRTLGDITPKKDKNILPPEPINNLGNIPSSPIRSLKPKKRWMKTVVQEQKQQRQDQATTCDDENLAMPIRWNENETSLPPVPLIRRGGNSSPVNWSVVSALVDLGQSTPMQPLNLSTSANRRC